MAIISGGDYRAGETISFIASVALGDIGDVTGTPECDMRRRTTQSGPTDADPVAASLSVEPFAGSANIPPGWIVTLSAAQSHDLERGTYVIDLRVPVGAEVYYSEAVSLNISSPVTVR